VSLSDSGRTAFVPVTAVVLGYSTTPHRETTRKRGCAGEFRRPSSANTDVGQCAPERLGSVKSDVVDVHFVGPREPADRIFIPEFRARRLVRKKLSRTPGAVRNLSCSSLNRYAGCRSRYRRAAFAAVMNSI
jgi:hypothetical protein